MKPSTGETRHLQLSLLDKTRCEIRTLLTSLDPDRIIHTDERTWRVRVCRASRTINFASSQFDEEQQIDGLKLDRLKHEEITC